ncbi:unnamed protein product (mitochondrion) [Plasmodiophora brassicae]|uniref:Uncharacterized protein n=1 Tax=Plasmodiophora brassicae TaxID=37360 RepID=A0A3P3YKA2_PLABS|nr:unnamed protein product [Plasmodiophora brassicae]
MMQRGGDTATSLPGTVGAASSVTVSPGAYVDPAAATHLATTSSAIALAIRMPDDCVGRLGRVPARSLPDPTGRAACASRAPS